MDQILGDQISAPSVGVNAMTDEMMKEKLERNKIPFHTELPHSLTVYLTLLAEWNMKMDLTAVDTPEEMADRHMTDSLTVLKTPWIIQGTSLIDVGTGAGFPGLPIAMARPDISVTLLDAQKKRLNFLENVCRETNVNNVTLVHARAEDAARMIQLREKFDIACARAVAPLNVLAEYLLPFVKIGGKALCWKGPGLSEEMSAGKKAAVILGGKTGEPVSFPIEGRDWQHMILPIQKMQHTAKIYPRKAGTPKSHPLGTGNT